ncbi:MAG: MFS transporter [Bacillota bacterium]|nr:MFS transporter [Bacillota bacterium]
MKSFSYLKIVLLGFGFLIITLTWSIYNAYVPPILERLLTHLPYTDTAVGFIMTFDNIAAILLIPWFGALSDRTWTRFGRRMPFLLISIPIAAFFFALIPTAGVSLITVIPVIIIMNIAMAAFRAPTIALMPDLTPSVYRSKANGIVNLMGGLGALVFYFGFTAIMGVQASFIVAAIIMILVLIILLLAIKEPKESFEVSEKRPDGIVASLVQVMTGKEGSTRFIFFAIFMWFIGWNGVETFFTLYGMDKWGIDESQAAFYLGFFSLSFLLMAIPSGFIATALGRKKTILAGLVGMCVMLGSFYFATPIVLAIGLLISGGVFWALININSYPMVSDMSPAGKLGTYTGLYYFFSMLAAIIAPPLFGVVMDLLGTRMVLFPMAALAYLAALFLMFRVRGGEAVEEKVPLAS